MRKKTSVSFLAVIAKSSHIVLTDGFCLCLVYAIYCNFSSTVKKSKGKIQFICPRPTQTMKSFHGSPFTLTLLVVRFNIDYTILWIFADIFSLPLLSHLFWKSRTFFLNHPSHNCRDVILIICYKRIFHYKYLICYCPAFSELDSISYSQILITFAFNFFEFYSKALIPWCWAAQNSLELCRTHLQSPVWLLSGHCKLKYPIKRDKILPFKIV